MLNFYKGKEKLKKILINEPYYINFLSKKLEEKNNNTPINENDDRSSLIKNITNYNNINNLNNSDNKNATYYYKDNLPKNFYDNIQSYINNTNNCQSNNYNNINNDNVESEDNSLLNKNILNNKLLFNYLKKEKDVKHEKKKIKETKQKQNLPKYKNISVFKNCINIDIKNKEEKIINRNNNELTSNSNIQSSLFKENNKSLENITNTYDKFNNNTIDNKEKRNPISNKYVEIEEDNFSNIIDGINQLKEISFKIILNEDEYSLLIQEKAKKINYLISN